jgi:hypothetical protein
MDQHSTGLLRRKGMLEFRIAGLVHASRLLHDVQPRRNPKPGLTPILVRHGGSVNILPINENTCRVHVESPFCFRAVTFGSVA